MTPGVAARPRAVVFDLDGTLADTVPDIAAALNEALAAAGLPPVPTREVTAMVGGGARLLAQRALERSGIAHGPPEIDALHAAFLAAYDAAPCRHSRLYDGAGEAVRALRDGGRRTGICTNKPEGPAAALVEALGIAHLFDAVVGGSPRLPLKPDPAMLADVLERLGVLPADATYVGDSETDVRTARALGVPVYVLTHGYSTTPVAALGADAVLDGFDALLPLLSGEPRR